MKNHRTVFRGLPNRGRTFTAGALRLVCGALPVLLSAATITVPATQASAQQRVMARSFIGSGGGGGGNQIGSRSIEKYGKILGLTDEQKETLKQLHEGYQATFRGASDAMQKEMEAARQAFEETEDRTVLGERIPAARKKFKDQTTKAETEFFSDLKQIITEKQTANWDRLERARRREVLLKGGSISGESVDLVDVIEGLGLKEIPKPLAEAVDLYEADLDRALQAKKSLQDKQGEFNFKPGAMDLSEIQKRSAETKEAGTKIKEVNQSYARKIETLLPEDSQAPFSKAVKRQSFPRVYKPSQVGKSLDAAMKFDDLDAGQKETLKSLRDSYEREVAPLNEAWASAIEESEKDPNNLSFGDGSMSISISTGPDNEKAETPLSKARKARREFDDQTRERLTSALTPAQREKLPKAAPGGPMGDMDTEDVVEGGPVGGGVFVVAPG